ncbi:MAG: tRNA (N6-isopentenyl adenosine(37)-C2)-methylthiotransferase MiaB [Clostridiales bacterium]|nr:tRNA (N6-isopentenyl adenosine(37)-C2)-methylthiotransferase MiaB [Candidatus Coliplasma caballi]
MEIFVDQKEIEGQREIALSLVPLLTGKKAVVRTFGCQQNEADGERIAGALALCGYTITDDVSEADLVILNTCAIREHAEERVLGNIGSLKKQKETRGTLIGMCGCMAQEAHRQELLFESYPFVDFLFGTDMQHRVPEIVKNALESRKQKQYVNDLPHSEFGVISEGTPVLRSGSYRALVSIMYGCNNFCSYCIVPYVRGRERSREAKNVLAEVSELAGSGYKDIMLLGQNVNSYKGELTFPELLAKCAETEGDFWLRFMTSHPKDASDALIDVMASHGKIADQFHLPFQSGSDRVLKEMNRRYTRAKYLETANKIKEKLPNASITSDVIVGFPGETESEFLETVDLVKEVGFDLLYTFIYSPRRGTVAEKMDGRIPREEQVRRFQYLSDVENAIALEKNQKMVGKTIRVLSDGEKDGVFCGRSSQNKIVTFDKAVPAGTFCEIEITSAKQYTLSGTVKGK